MSQTPPNLNDCVTLAQFNELKESLEATQQKTNEDIQNLTALLQNRAPNSDLDGSQEDEYEGSDEESVARRARHQQRLRNQNDRRHERPHGRGRDNMGGGFGRGRGRGHHFEDQRHVESEQEEEHDAYRYRRNRPQEERFGKLKFTMPKFDGGSDPEVYLTC